MPVYEYRCLEHERPVITTEHRRIDDRENDARCVECGKPAQYVISGGNGKAVIDFREGDGRYALGRHFGTKKQMLDYAARKGIRMHRDG